MGNYKSFGDTKFVPSLPKVSRGGLGKVGNAGLVGVGGMTEWSLDHVAGLRDLG